MKCCFCEKDILYDLTGEPYLEFKNKTICCNCYIGIIPKIYKMSGYGDGGLINLIFKFCLSENHNKKNRTQIRQYKKIFNELLHKYKFNCIACNERDISKLTIDHIKPVSKGGTDEILNLQILCKSCNSKKGNKYG
jgi:hypothetical protein